MSRAEESLQVALARPAQAGEPGFLAALRRAGAEEFGRLLLPTTRHEEWRYTSLAGLADLALTLAEPGAVALPAGFALPPAPRLVLVNGRVDPSRTDLAGLPPGARVGSLATALRERPGAVEPLLARGPFREHAFAALSDALFADGLFLELPAGVAVEAPIHVVHLTLAGAGQAVGSFPRSLLLLGEGAKAAVVEHWTGSGTYLAAGLTQAALGERSALELVRVQDEAPGAFHVGLVGVSQQGGSRYTSRSVALGARLARVETRAVLAGEEIENHLDGLYVAGGSQVHDHFIHVDHARPHGLSREWVKGILDGSSRGVFTGRVLVREGAQKTDASQVSSNLLLSEEATVDTRPQLEILADDVKCSHGGTVGQLDDDALFYLRSRGLDRATARAVLTWAFAAEMVERLPVQVREGVRRLVTAHLPDGSRLQEAA